MKSLIKIIVVIVFIIILISAVYVVFYLDDNNNDNNNNNNEIDEEPPKINSVTGDTTVKKGNSITISISYSDNVNVTEALIYYRRSSDEEWNSASILSGNIDIYIPANSNESWYYYVTVDDEAGNGPVRKPSVDGTYYTITVQDNGNNGNNGEVVRTVFIEESTATTCKYCTNVAEILHELFDPNDPDFYYISMVEDENSKAYERVVTHYNRYANPTVYIDGGYEVILAYSDDYKSKLKQRISNAANREVPELNVKLSTEWNETRTELTARVSVENKEQSQYTGQLKVFISEIVSTRWKDYNIEPFHYAFLDYAINEDISINSNDNVTFSNTWNASSAGFSNVVPENLMMIAVVFNSEINQEYSDPANNKNPFNAHYADATVGAKVGTGTLPPTIGINKPKPGFRYFYGREQKQFIIKKSILIGRAIINATVEAEAGVEKVEFYIDGKLKQTFTEEPYKLSMRKINWRKKFFSKHTILVRAYDLQNRTASDSIDVITLFV